MKKDYDDRFEASKSISGIGFSYSGRVFTDRETGVQYLYINGGYGGGLCPLIDREGKPLLADDAKARL